jgi:hypothetical protein
MNCWRLAWKFDVSGLALVRGRLERADQDLLELLTSDGRGACLGLVSLLELVKQFAKQSEK